MGLSRQSGSLLTSAQTQSKVPTLGETWCYVEAEKPIDTLADTQSEAKAAILSAHWAIWRSRHFLPLWVLAEAVAEKLFDIPGIVDN